MFPEDLAVERGAWVVWAEQEDQRRVTKRADPQSFGRALHIRSNDWRVTKSLAA
jgi:hypothetical protein